MNITNSITNGMTPQEKDIYFKHMEKRHREEKEKLDAQKSIIFAIFQERPQKLKKKNNLRNIKVENIKSKFLLFFVFQTFVR